MLPSDYQWPAGVLPKPSHYQFTSATERAALQQSLERWFSVRLGHDCLLLPSGRAALSLALASMGVERGHTMFAPRWSSHCVWSVVGRYANPTTTISAEVDAMLAVYKFGRPEHLAEAPAPHWLVEDSCDSIVIEPEALFANGGICELFSLPKIMGTYAGGLLVFADATLAAQARTRAADSEPFSTHQGRARWALAQGDAVAYNAWDGNEYQNFLPDANLLLHLQDHLPALSRNSECIRQRLQALQQRCAHWFSPADSDWFSRRLPPVLCVPPNALPLPLMTRRVNTSGWFDRPDFAARALVPLHFGVDERSFDSLLKALDAA